MENRVPEMAMTLSVGVERTGSEERVCRIRLCLEGCLNDVSILGTRRGGACSVVVSEDVGGLVVQVLFLVSKFIPRSTFVSIAFVH